MRLRGTFFCLPASGCCLAFACPKLKRKQEELKRKQEDVACWLSLARDWVPGASLLVAAADSSARLQSSSPQKHKLNELRDARPPDEVEEENTWIAFKEVQAVSQKSRKEGGERRGGGGVRRTLPSPSPHAIMRSQRKDLCICLMFRMAIAATTITSGILTSVCGAEQAYLTSRHP